MDILQCAKCRLIFRWPADAPEELNVHYESEYAEAAPQVRLPGAQELQELVTDSVDGFILSDPADSAALAGFLRQLYGNPDLCRSLGENAARTAQAYSWDRNASETWEFLMSALEKKRHA